MTKAVPAAAHIEPALVQPLVPGDHLQFMYYCWLAGDMLAGKTPLFCNPYEFNTGEGLAKPSVVPIATRIETKESEKKPGYRPDAYYFPFSLIYAVFSFFGGRALGWNLTGFLTIWITYFLTWLLVRRYAKPEWIAACAALIAIIFPFRWINLCGGSPAGFACAWIPAIFLGIDLAVRDGRISGGLLTGFSILFASWTDNHIFFFGTLAAPFWALIALTAGQDKATSRQQWMKIIIALLPIPVLLGCALLFPALMRNFAGAAGTINVGSTVAARSWHEIMLYSPNWRGFFSIMPLGISDQIYIGFTVTAFLVIGGLFVFCNAFRNGKENWHRLAVMVLLGAAIIGIMALALGTNGPLHGICLKICRKVIAPYTLIRQPAKIFCLMPALLAVAGGLSLSAILSQVKSSGIKILLALLFCAVGIYEYSARVHPTISILDTKQGAYEAVANDAVSVGKPPHVLVIPLWPGDSHYSSIYQYYASLYRLRMVNGYNPFVSKSYFDNVFRRYESANQGWLTDEQMDELSRRGIGYVILHEDLFPEKVSPFAIGFTLKNLLENHRLEVLKQDGRVWAFKIFSKPIQTPQQSEAATLSPVAAALSCRVSSNTVNWSPFACARNWQAEACARGSVKFIRASSKPRPSYAVLDNTNAYLAIQSVRVAPAERLRWMLRARGQGTISAETTTKDEIISRHTLDIQTNDWCWFDIPVANPSGNGPGLTQFAPLDSKIQLLTGTVDCDQILLTAGNLPVLQVGQTIALPAPSFFHAGYTSLADNSVVFEKGRDFAQAVTFYGLKLPLEKGSYVMELMFDSAAPKGTLLGQFTVKRHADDIITWVPVVAGSQSFTEFTQLENLPMHLEFIFAGNADLAINAVKITRKE